MDEVKDAPNAITTVLLQPTQLEKTKKFVENTWNHEIPKLNIPMGVEWTDEFLMKVSELTGKPIPDSLAKERGRCMDLISDSHAWLHGKKFALYGDPDFVLGMVKILLEVRRRTDPHPGPQRQQALGQGRREAAGLQPVRRQWQGLCRQRPVAHAQPVLHRQA